MISDKTTDLGCANGWKEMPKEVVECKGKEHERDRKTIGRCLIEISCSICNYRYEVDSSD